jgi:hypothetical protein
MNQRQAISNLKIRYDGKTYDKILYFSIHGLDEYNKYEVGFTNQETEKETVNIECMLRDIKVIIGD